jgi:hypothetical protein
LKQALKQQKEVEMKKVLLLAATVAATVGTGVGSTAAATGPAPGTGQPGAWDMLHDATMLPGAGGAMDHDNINGNIGMCRAVLVSSGIGC